MSDRFDTTDLLNCYRRGVFPMADSREDMRLFLMDPDVRGVLPLQGFHVPTRLRKLEDQLGVRLLERTTRSVTLTESGEIFYERALALLNDAEATEQLLSADELQPEGLLRISD